MAGTTPGLGTHVARPEPFGLALLAAGVVGLGIVGGWLVIGRRRPGRAGAPATQAVVAGGVSTAAASLSRRFGGDRSQVESSAPRWRRRSARRERSWTPLPTTGDGAADRVARFDNVYSDSRMRRFIRDDRVTLLNVPHELLGSPLTSLDPGREVELLESRDTWVRVRTSWGDEGWLREEVLRS